jgi:hypothetical protein
MKKLFISMISLLFTLSLSPAWADTVTVVSPQPVPVTGEPSQSTTVTTDDQGNVSSTVTQSTRGVPDENTTVVMPSNGDSSSTTVTRTPEGASSTTVHEDGSSTTYETHSN